jgi:FAD synthase
MKRQRGRLRHTLEYNIKMKSKELGEEGVYWIRVAQDTGSRPAVVNTAVNFLVP